MNRIFTVLLLLGFSASAAAAPAKQASTAQLIELLEQQQEEFRQLREQVEELNHQIKQMRKDGEMSFLDHSAIKAPISETKKVADATPKHKESVQNDHSDDMVLTPEDKPANKKAKKTTDEKSNPKAQPTKNTNNEGEKTKSKVVTSATTDLVDETPAHKDMKQPTVDLADQSTAPQTNSSIVYNEARSLLDQKRFAEAEVVLTQFIKKYPKDPMLVNAYYWLAETYYIRSDYTQAALKFGDAYQAYQDHKNSAYKEAANSKGPEIIFKLASSLYNIGKYQEAKITLDELGKEFPKLPANIKQQADLLRREIARKANQA